MTQKHVDEREFTYAVEKGAVHGIDVMGEDGLGVYSRKTIDEIRADYGPVEVLTGAELLARTRETFCSSPERTTLEQWEELLNVLPPMKWVRAGHTESFMVCEPYAADVHTACVRIGDEYFTFNALRSSRHEDLVKQVREHFKLDH